MNTDILRNKFLEFFKSQKHKIIESDSLVPVDDPTVLFTPAGMNQFKKEFLGHGRGLKRAATAQRCLRTDDLDKVGKTSGHHTFFEMLGNFSFGDYFKEEAISFAWKFLTEGLAIEKEKLWVSVYKDDDEAYKIWKDKIKVGENKIVKLGDKENFWPSQAKEKGPNGPCGPCSEIFFDWGKDAGCGRPDCNPACSCGRFVEVWNLVFTQFNRKEGGVLEPLPQKNIDTGMGLERLAAVTQGLQSNFETDLFQPIIKEIAGGQSPAGTVPKKELVYAVADHIRAIVFAIYDGVMPSNEERGYVVRKLIRRSQLHLRALGIKKPFLFKLVPLVSQTMSKPYAELDRRRENIAQIILTEEEGFISILNSSVSLFKDKFAGFSNKQNPERAGKIAFGLYDTYGIPLELTKDWLDKQGIAISQDSFNQELAEQKSRSKLKTAMKGDVFGDKELRLNIKETKFLGYKEYRIKAKIIAIIKNGAHVKKINKGEEATIILDKTVFYPESGGQVGDTGEFVKGKSSLEVLDTKKAGKVIMHTGRVKEGSFKKNGLVSAGINAERRLSIARNHTATHLLQAALRKVLGSHVRQQGSLVAEDRLRFDFTHFKAVEKTKLDRIEEIVNGYIISNYPVEVKQMSLSEAKKKGALAFFGEKYENKVCVVSIGDFSKELCGGSHLNSTGQIGLFKLLQESSIASGVRRIEASTGTFAYKVVKGYEDIIAEVSAQLDVQPDRIPQELKNRLSRIKELERQSGVHQIEGIKSSLDEAIKNAQKINNINLITKAWDNLSMEFLRKSVDMIKEKVGGSIIALGSRYKGKVLLVMGITPDLVGRGLDASSLIKLPAQLLGGSGGGRKDFAQAGGNSPENLEAAFDGLRKAVAGLS